MAPTVVALSGRICAGKTTLARHLVVDPGAIHLSTSGVLRRRLDASRAATDRKALQEFGHRLDKETDGRWIADAVLPVAQSANRLVIIDAVRVAEQLDHLRESLAVFHLHLTAPLDILAARYESARRQQTRGRDAAGYMSLAADATEAQVETLAARADVVIDTAANTEQATHGVAAAFIVKRST